MENHFNCIYCYTNKVNGKKYIGQAVDFLIRHKQHINQAYNEKQKRNYNVPFHNAIRKHGIENFEIEILIENLRNREELNYWECFYIIERDTLAKNQKGYNLASGGEGGNTIVGKTKEEVAEIRKKQSEANKGLRAGENHPCAILVDRFDKQGNYIDTKYQFEYVQLGFNSGNISNCCKGRYKSTSGYIFKYHDE